MGFHFVQFLGGENRRPGSTCLPAGCFSCRRSRERGSGVQKTGEMTPFDHLGMNIGYYYFSINSFLQNTWTEFPLINYFDSCNRGYAA